MIFSVTNMNVFIYSIFRHIIKTRFGLAELQRMDQQKCQNKILERFRELKRRRRNGRGCR